MTLITVDLDYIAKINNKENFSFSRFGDGEWNCILQKQGRNCDQHIYYPDMGIRLKSILMKSPNYYVGLQNLAYRLHTDYINQFTEDFNIKWCKSDMLHHDSIKTNLTLFFEAISNRNVLLVAPERLKQLKIWNKFISIPDVNCWLNYELIKKEISLALEKDIVVLYCASMMSNILIDDFSKEEITQIDCGSIFEPYIGFANRTYHKQKIQELK